MLWCQGGVRVVWEVLKAIVDRVGMSNGRAFALSFIFWAERIIEGPQGHCLIKGNFHLLLFRTVLTACRIVHKDKVLYSKYIKNVEWMCGHLGLWYKSWCINHDKVTNETMVIMKPNISRIKETNNIRTVFTYSHAFKCYIYNCMLNLNFPSIFFCLFNTSFACTIKNTRFGDMENKYCYFVYVYRKLILFIHATNKYTLKI